MGIKLVKLDRKDKQYFLDGELLDWIKFPSTQIDLGNAWVMYNEKDECRGVYLAGHQCCTGVLIWFFGQEVHGIIQLPIGIEELQCDPEDGERMIAFGSACSGEGSISLYYNLGNGDWKWKNMVRGQRSSMLEILVDKYGVDKLQEMNIKFIG